jgi:hypothetical protein
VIPAEFWWSTSAPAASSIRMICVSACAGTGRPARVSLRAARRKRHAHNKTAVASHRTKRMILYNQKNFRIGDEESVSRNILQLSSQRAKLCGTLSNRQVVDLFKLETSERANTPKTFMRTGTQTVVLLLTVVSALGL